MGDFPSHAEQRWLLLIHQIPSSPSYLRVKIWRRLQGIGAVAIKNTVYVLPANPETREDFTWLLKEIVKAGGEAMVCKARLIGGLSDDQARALFDAARDADYEAIASDARALIVSVDGSAPDDDRTEARGRAVRLRKRLTDAAAIDFFGATGRLAAEAAVSELERRLAPMERTATEQPEAALTVADLIGRIWVTRKGVHVDRIACSWLIRRFIDPDAVIRFVSGKGYVPEPGELRFDMFEGEFSHEGDRCSFEVLLIRAGLDDPALQEIAEIVHDIDLKDGKFAREEAPGIALLIAGIAMGHAGDDDRIAQGSTVLENLYQYFRRKRSQTQGTVP